MTTINLLFELSVRELVNYLICEFEIEIYYFGDNKLNIPHSFAMLLETETDWFPFHCISTRLYIFDWGNKDSAEVRYCIYNKFHPLLLCNSQFP